MSSSFLFLTIIAIITLSIIAPGGVESQQTDMTTAQKDTLRATLNKYAALLNNTVSDATTRFASVVTSCSGHLEACNPYASVSTINFQNTIPTADDKVQIKPYTSASQTAANHLSTGETCAFNLMGTKWKANWASSNSDSSLTNVLYQYGALTTNFAAWLPAAEWSSCTTTWTPTQRPWYSVSAAGAKDVVILVDRSTKHGTANLLSIAKSLAKNIVSSLSYRDRVKVLGYDETVDAEDLMAPADIATQTTINTGIDALTEATGKGANLGLAFQQALQTFSQSRKLKMSTECTKVIILLTGGTNDEEAPLPGRILQGAEGKDALLFPFLITSGTAGITSSKLDLVKQLSCAMKSIYVNITTSTAADLLTASSVPNNFLAAMAGSGNSPVRASEIYTDAAGQGEILSLSAPFFTTDSNSVKTLKGVVSLDIKYSALSQSGALSKTMINDFSLGEAKCSKINTQGDDSKHSLVKQQQGLLGMDQCANVDVTALGFKTTATDNELLAEKAKIAVVIVIVLLTVLLAVIAYQFVQEVTEGDCGSMPDEDSRDLSLCLIVSFVVCWIIAMAVCFSLVYPDLVELHNFKQVPATVVSTTATAFRCCEMSSCSSCSYTSETSCSEKLRTLTAGTCSSGFYCCQKYTYSCNCRDVRSCEKSGNGKGSGQKRCSTRRKCSTCTRCVKSVSRRACTISCGNCYRMATILNYEFSGTPYRSSVAGTCKLSGAESCKAKWLSEYTKGAKITVYVNPSHPIDIRRDVTPRVGPLAAFIVFTALGGICIVSVFVLIIFNNDSCEDTFKCEDDAPVVHQQPDKPLDHWDVPQEQPSAPVVVDPNLAIIAQSGCSWMQPKDRVVRWLQQYGKSAELADGYLDAYAGRIDPDLFLHLFSHLGAEAPMSGFGGGGAPAGGTGDNVAPPAGGYDFGGGGGAAPPGGGV